MIGVLFMNKHTNNEGWENNRYKNLRITRKSVYWCTCDRNLISKGEICSVCKRRPEQKRFKKY